MEFELPENADGRTLYNLGNAHFRDESFEQAAYKYEAAIDRLIARLDMEASTPFDCLAYRFDIVLRGPGATLFENRPEGD